MSDLLQTPQRQDYSDKVDRSFSFGTELKRTFSRHFAFTHKKFFELTEIRPEDLNPKGSSGRAKRNKPAQPETERDSRDEDNNELGADKETIKKEESLVVIASTFGGLSPS